MLANLAACQYDEKTGKSTDPSRSWFANLLFPCSAASKSSPASPTGAEETAFAQWYQKVMYGEIPNPIAAQPPGVPSTYDYETGTVSGDPNEIITDLAKQSQQKTFDIWKAAYDQAVASGAYNPSGNLPVTASDLDKVVKDYGIWIVLGLLGVGAFVLLKR